MKATLRAAVCGSALVGLLLVGHAKGAITIDGGPVYPAPGGNGWSGYGDPATSGGLHWTYTSFDLSQTAELYFGLDNTQTAGLSMNNPAGSSPASQITGLENFAYSYFSGNTAYWTGQTSIWHNSGGYYYSKTVDTLMLVNMGGLGSWISDATTSGLALTSDVGALWHVQGDFTMNVYLYARDAGTGSCYNADYYFDTLHNTPPNYANAYNFATGFYYQNVPEPTTLAIWSALGGLGLIAARRRRKSICPFCFENGPKWPDQAQFLFTWFA